MTAIDVMLQQQTAQAIGWALVQFIWQGALIGVLTAALLALLRRSAADVRYVVSTISLALMLTMPVVTAMQSFSAVARPRVDASPAPAAPRTGVRIGFQEVISSPEPAGAAAPLAFVSPAAAARDPLERWLPVLVGVWLAGVAMLTLRLFSGWLWVQRMKSHGARPAAAAIEVLAQRLIRRLHIRRGVRLLESSIVDVPTVIGWVKPVVLLPASALAGLTPLQLEAILAHELAHIRRHDYLVNLLQTVVETLLFYHPAVWWVSRRIRVERENCCDDLAVSLCGDPVTYAAALAEMEGMRGAKGRLVLAANGGSLLQRVRRLLGAPSHAGRAPGWLAAGLAVLVIVGIAAGAVGRDIVVAEGDTAVIGALEPGDDRRVGPLERSSPAAPPAPPAPPPPIEQAIEADELAQIRALAAIRRMTGGISRQTATRQCMNWVRDGIPVQFRGHAEVLRGACSALAAVSFEARRLADAAQEAAAQAPAAVAAATEPVHEVAAAIAEISRTANRDLKPVFEELSRALERASRQAAASTPRMKRSESQDQSGNFTWSNNGQKLEVSYRGRIEFTDDDTDVKSLGPDGWLKIKDGGRFGTDNTIEFKSDGAGNIQRRFWKSGSERPFEPEGRKWLADMLPRFIRQSGIGARGRVERIYKTKGSAGVFAEIALIEGSWAKRVYYSHLLEQPGIASRDVQQALAQAGREIDSDFELASLLISADHLVKDDATRKAYFDAAGTIGSDFEMRRTFSSALKNGPVTPALLAGVLDASTAIDSDFEEASLLVQVAGLQPLDATTREAFFRALDTVDSAFERARVLKGVMNRRDLSPEVLASALQSAAQVSSDFECASVLLQFTKEHPIEGPVRPVFFTAVSGIDSAFERGRVLQSVAKRPDASDETILGVIKAASTMTSSHEKAQVLLTVASAHELTREGRDAYIDASGHLGDFEQGRVLSALVKNERRR